MAAGDGALVPGRIDPRLYRRIVVLTGAGISVASGIAPFSGPGGIWNEEGALGLSTPEHFLERTEKFWDFWKGVRRACLAAAPNPAHLALASFESSLPRGSSFTLITQNIDGLHRRAGSRDTLEYHGSVLKTRCSNRDCPLEAFEDPEVAEGTVPRCPRCDAPLRPDFVMFGEMIPAECDWRAKRALRDCELFIAVGTSGMVYPASRFAASAKYAGARTILVNLEAPEGDWRSAGFDETILGKAEEILPGLLGIGIP